MHQDRLFPLKKQSLYIARELYEEIKSLPIISPHGHTDPSWFAKNLPFSDPVSLLLTPDHYILRMLHSMGIDYDYLGVPRKDGKVTTDARSVWRLFGRNYYLFLGTPSKLWIDYTLKFIFGVEKPLTENTADEIYDSILNQLKNPDFLPRSILDRLNIEVVATTELALDPLIHHKKMLKEGVIGRIITTYRPDDVTNPDYPDFTNNILKFGELTGENVTKWGGLINAHRKRREFFRRFGATATDHATQTLLTTDLSLQEKQKLLTKALKETLDSREAELFRAQMLTEMALLSSEDGMVMQIHAGSYRNTDQLLMMVHGFNLGADIPVALDCTNGLKALLNCCGHEKKLRIVLFVLDETSYSREIAPMAGYWPSLMIGPPWWFHDSPQGIRRYLDQVVETAGFFNLAGFNDDTRALLSIPARHDVWRREICRFLAERVSEYRITILEAKRIAKHLAYQAAKDTYRLS